MAEQQEQAVVCSSCGLDEKHVQFNAELFLYHETTVHTSELNGCDVAKVYAERDHYEGLSMDRWVEIIRLQDEIAQLRKDKEVLVKALVKAGMFIARS